MSDTDASDKRPVESPIPPEEPESDRPPTPEGPPPPLETPPAKATEEDEGAGALVLSAERKRLRARSPAREDIQIRGAASQQQAPNTRSQFTFGPAIPPSYHRPAPPPIRSPPSYNQPRPNWDSSIGAPQIHTQFTHNVNSVPVAPLPFGQYAPQFNQPPPQNPYYQVDPIQSLTAEFDQTLGAFLTAKDRLYRLQSTIDRFTHSFHAATAPPTLPGAPLLHRMADPVSQAPYQHRQTEFVPTHPPTAAPVRPLPSNPSGLRRPKRKPGPTGKRY